jgi:ribonucleoside-triphosphate reductase
LLDEVVDSGKLPRNYLFFGDQKDGRGNITPATVILPTLAMEAFKKGKSEEERFNWIAKQSPEAAKFTYENNTMKGYIKENLKSCQIHDEIKNEYCKNNNINLLRIRYDEDTEKILTEYFQNNKIIKE